MKARSKIHKGLQTKGNTKIDSTILIEKTGAMQITVRKGAYTDVLGTVYKIPADTVIDVKAGTDNYVALIHNPTTKENRIWHAEVTLPWTTPHVIPEPPADFKLLQTLIGWGWFIIPTGTTDITDIPLYCFTWIDNVPIRYKPELDPETLRIVAKPKIIGKGEETGKEYEFDEIEHFVADKPGIYFYCPKDGMVTRGRPCKVCGNLDTVKIKEVKK